jgi:TonB family protein
MKILSLGLVLGFLSVSGSLAPLSEARQDSKNDRRLLTRVEPDYPSVLRMRQIGGTVRLEVTVTAGGTVESAKVLGGNPILAESAVAAVKKWKYASAEGPTTTTVSLEFNPYR